MPSSERCRTPESGVAFGQHPFEKLNLRGFRHCLSISWLQKSYPAQLETAIMNPWMAAMASLCREVVLPVLVFALIVASGFAGIDNTRAAPMADRLAQSLTAESADELQPIASGTTPEKVTASRPAAEAATADATPAAHKPEPIVTAALTESSGTLRADPPPEQTAETKTAALEPGDSNQVVGSPEVRDDCFVADSCVDHYLWALYQHTPKEDAIKIQERKKVTIKKKGRLVTVTKTFTILADEDFSWKDPKAAEKEGIPMMDYVIGGMDRDFKLKLFHMLHTAEEAGLSPGITSAFRDDYRQSIASGLKAANDRSYHGGSSRGGYGHGLAADIVSVNGATRAQRLTSTENLWKWIDAHGEEFGIGRPYLDRDPPHVAPIDGKEYADHHPGMKTRQAAKPSRKLTLGNDRIATKHVRAARSS
jgi:hypothetical protein